MQSYRKDASGGFEELLPQLELLQGNLRAFSDDIGSVAPFYKI